MRALADLHEYKRELRESRRRVIDVEHKVEQSNSINGDLRGELDQAKAKAKSFENEVKTLSAVNARDLKRVEAETQIHADVVASKKLTDVSQGMQGY